jgi:tetratricopeptide (TPR) repeat protein
VRGLDEIETSPEEFPASVAAELIEAIAQFETKLALAKSGPLSAWEHVLRARAHQFRLAVAPSLDALDEARKAVAAAPDFGMAHSALAMALCLKLAASGSPCDAEHDALVREIHEHIGQALRLDGDNPAILLASVGAYSSLGDTEAGLRLALRATKRTPNSPDAQAALGLAYFLAGRTGDAIAVYSKQDRLASLDSFRTFGLWALGVCLFIEGRPAEAEAAIDRSLGLHPDNAMALSWKAIIAADLGNHEAGTAAVRLLLATNSGLSTDESLIRVEELPFEHPRKYEAVAILQRLIAEAR